MWGCKGECILCYNTKRLDLISKSGCVSGFLECTKMNIHVRFCDVICTRILVLSSRPKRRKTLKLTSMKPLLQVWVPFVVVIRKGCTMIEKSESIVCDLRCNCDSILITILFKGVWWVKWGLMLGLIWVFWWVTF